MNNISNINKKILEDSMFVEDCYVAQTKAFSPGEYDFIGDLLRKHNIKKFLDIGTGNGVFLAGLAENHPGIRFDAIDADDTLIRIAVQNNRCQNISYRQAFFDPGFKGKEYDLIHARFAVEHMPDVIGFVSEAFKRLKKNGILLITEYFIDDLHTKNEPWKLFRQKESEFYKKFGSHARISLRLPGFFRDCGFSEIGAFFRQISPAIIGKENFYDLIKTYTVLYHRIEKDIFTDEITDRIIEYADSSPGDCDDLLLISHTTGIKH